MDYIDLFSIETIRPYRADRFQIARNCSTVSIVENRKNIRLSGTGA